MYLLWTPNGLFVCWSEISEFIPTPRPITKLWFGKLLKEETPAGFKKELPTC